MESKTVHNRAIGAKKRDRSRHPAPAVNSEGTREQPTSEVWAGGRDATRSTIVVTTVNFVSDDGEVGLGGVQRIRFPGKPDGRHLDVCLELTRGPSANEPEVFGWVLISHRLAR